MQALFCSISVIGLAYFLLAKRYFDWFAVAFFSSCIYFIPGFFGYTAYLTIAGWNEQVINQTAYKVMTLVLFAILIFAIITDILLFSNKPYIPVDKNLSQENNLLLFTLLLLAIVGLFFMFLVTGESLFESDKRTMMEKLNRFHILFYISTILGCTLSFECKKWRVFLCFCFLVLFDIFIGFRITVAIITISIFTLWMYRQGKTRFLFSNWKVLLYVLPLVMFLFLYKQIAFSVKFGDFELITSILSNINTYSAMLTNSEPFICQSILNEVTYQDYYVGVSHLKSVMYQFVLFSPELGFEIKTFNELFQQDLFPSVDYGMANNIWAEMWSAGGWYLVIIFLLVFLTIIKIFCILTATSDKKIWRATIAVMASFWVFYIHRNDISYAITLEKRVLLVMCLSVLIACLLNRLKIMKQLSIKREMVRRNI